jgi:hypothetical protein
MQKVSENQQVRIRFVEPAYAEAAFYDHVARQGLMQLYARKGVTARAPTPVREPARRRVRARAARTRPARSRWWPARAPRVFCPWPGGGVRGWLVGGKQPAGE